MRRSILGALVAALFILPGCMAQGQLPFMRPQVPAATAPAPVQYVLLPPLPPPPAEVPPVAQTVPACPEGGCIHSHYWCETVNGTPTFGWKSFTLKEEALTSPDSFKQDPRFNHVCATRSPLVAGTATGWDVYPPHGYTLPPAK